MAQLLGVEPARIEVDQVGLNHLTWVRAVRLDGEDVLGALLADHGDALAEGAGLPRRLLEELGAVPSYYLHYFYEHDRVLAEQREGVPRAAEVAEIERRAARDVPRPGAEREAGAARAARRRVLQRGRHRHRRLAGGRAATPCTSSTCATTARSPAWPTTTSSRSPRASGRDGPVALRQAPLAPELLGPRPARRRLRAARGARRAVGRPLDVRKALLAHPLIGQDEMAGELLERLLAGEPVR